MGTDDLIKRERRGAPSPGTCKTPLAPSLSAFLPERALADAQAVHPASPDPLYMPDAGIASPRSPAFSPSVTPSTESIGSSQGASGSSGAEPASSSSGHTRTPSLPPLSSGQRSASSPTQVPGPSTAAHRATRAAAPSPSSSSSPPIASGRTDKGKGKARKEDEEREDNPNPELAQLDDAVEDLLHQRSTNQTALEALLASTTGSEGERSTTVAATLAEHERIEQLIQQVEEARARLVDGQAAASAALRALRGQKRGREESR